MEAVEELAGVLEVSGPPEITAGYADIYHGFWRNLQGERIEVAIKELKTIIPKDRRSDREGLKRRTETRLKLEVFVWSQTKHPNLHPLLGYRSHPKPRLISPWCHHGNLKDYLRANPGFSRSDKLRLIYQTACGLDHLHSQDPPICHADIKPENVLINDSRDAALSDFGLSRVLQELGGHGGFTTSETAKGTLRYMAGELFAGHKPNRETDVYAFGGLMLTVMSGKIPFDGLAEQVIILRVLQGQPPKPDHHPNLPADDPLWKLMRRCWDKTAAARPTMREVLVELWEDISRETSDPRSRLGLPSVSEDDSGNSETSDIDLIPGALDQGGNSSLLTANLDPQEDSSSSPPQAEEAHDQTPEEGLLVAQKTLESLAVSARTIPIIGRYVEAAVDVGLALIEIVQTMRMSEDMTTRLKLNLWNLAMHFQDLEEKSSQHDGDVVVDDIADTQWELQCMQEEIKDWEASDLVRDAVDDHGSFRRRQRMVRSVLDKIQLLVSLNTSSLVTGFGNTELQEQQRRLLNCLGNGRYGAQGNAIEDVICFPGTRVEILERIDDWIRDASTPNRVLWIRGMAGRGKSTIVSTVAHSWKHRASCAIFHFRRDQNALNTRVICALARQLGSSLVPEVRNAVLESVRENDDIADQRLDEQFKSLLVASLAKLRHQSHPIVILVDALDECNDTKDAVDLIKLIDRHSSSFLANVKFILTCRPEGPLLRILEPKKWQMEDLDLSPDVSSDLSRFISQACTRIREDHGLRDDWPSSSDVARLVEMSQGLFQWARTAITHINDGSPIHRLQDLLKQPSSWSELDDLYHQILSKAFENIKLDQPRHQLLNRLLGTLVVAPHPVSLEAIAVLDGDHSIFEGTDQEGIIQIIRKDILSDLNSLLVIPDSRSEPMRLIHTSIRDLLTHEQRCKNKLYYIDVVQHHQRLANLCLRLMVRSLRENICNLANLSKANSEVQDIVARKLSAAIRYCCRAWSIHLTEGAPRSGLDASSPVVHLGDFEIFSKKKLLYWLEVMSLIGSTAEASMIARRVHRFLVECQIPGFTSLIELWNDTQRFVTLFSEPISFGSSHIYISALSHCPRKTELWKYYGSHAKIQSPGTLQPLNWPSNIWTISVGSPVNTVAFSPNGTILVSGSDDQTLRLWDARTATPLSDPLTGHTNLVCSVAFSPHGTILASGDGDGIIRLWDAETGMPLGLPLIGHVGFVNCMVFSADGKVLASGSDDCTIQLWDGQTGEPLGDPLTGDNSMICSVAFSPDGKYLASGDGDGAVWVWDTKSGMPLGEPLLGHGYPVRSLMFSRDGKVLSAASIACQIRSWNPRTGMALGKPTEDHNIRRIRTVILSPDSKVMASGSKDHVIRFWDAQSRLPLGMPQEGHNAAVNSVAFSPDGNVLASASDDGTIRMWLVQTSPSPGNLLLGERDSVRTLAFSEDGAALSVGDSNAPTQLPDEKTRMTLSKRLRGLSRYVHSVTLSPDGKVLVSGSVDGTIQLWDTRTGTPFGDPVALHTDCVNSIGFSPDGNIFASGSDDSTVRLWSRRTGSALGEPLKGHTDFVRTVGFSPNGKLLASGSDDCTIQLWNADTGTPLGDPLIGHVNYVRSVTFSPNSQVLASGSNDCTIQLWDVQSRTPLGKPLISRSNYVHSIVFSPDGKVLASGYDDCAVQLWDIQTGIPLGKLLTDYGGMLSSTFVSQGDRWLPRVFPCHIPTFQDRWVTLFSSRLFWLPSQYWVDQFPKIHLSDQILFVFSSGALTIFDMSGVLPRFN